MTVRCPGSGAWQQDDRFDSSRCASELDSIGGASANLVATGVPAGWGEPVFDKLKADLAKGR